VLRGILWRPLEVTAEVVVIWLNEHVASVA
jgi:hypothetical protein